MFDPVLLTYYGSVALGCLLLLAVLFIFLTKKKLEFGGVILMLTGFALFGLPIWKTLEPLAKRLVLSGLGALLGPAGRA
jgi:hypothetical protein